MEPNISSRPEQEIVDVRTGGPHVHSHERPRQNAPHQLAPSVGIRNPHLHISDHAGNSRRLSELRRRRDTSNAKVPTDHHFPDDESSNSNYAPQKQRGTTRYLPGDGDSSDSHTRCSNYQSRYDLTTSDSTPERSSIRENQSRRQGKPIRTPERSPIKEYPLHYTDRQPQEDRRHQKK
ncbi:hypothetical protein LIER_23942 [Lithospermum erythrorhizon]|uniref:Uncharacterized protein n=1 Tax=Lithospermum erythrorhizon TaxID=34254 RepID=A0AAV3R0U0_LITER